MPLDMKMPVGIFQNIRKCLKFQKMPARTDAHRYVPRFCPDMQRTNIHKCSQEINLYKSIITIIYNIYSNVLIIIINAYAYICMIHIILVVQGSEGGCWGLGGLFSIGLSLLDKQKHSHNKLGLDIIIMLPQYPQHILYRREVTRLTDNIELSIFVSPNSCNVCTELTVLF